MDATSDLPEPPLRLLVATYFGEDWDLNGPNALAVIEHFAASEPRHAVAEARDDATGLLATGLTGEELERELDALGLAYDPEFEGRTHHQWLALIVDRLNRSLQDEPG